MLTNPVKVDAQTSEISSETRAAWGFDRSDLAPHPAIRFGVLANGLRYALMRHQAPAGGLSVRLHLDAGAMAEGPDEIGHMHVIEHLIFHGSEHVPEGSLQRLLANAGLQEWRDFNAFTTYDETVFQLDLGEAGTDARATALTVMRDVAGGLRFNAGAVAGAKEKVREEIRTRDAVADRIAAAQNGFYFPGTAIARGPVAGTERDVKRVRPAALRRLYDRHYAPAKATLVMVGDIDPVTVEAEISARFADWRARAAPPAPASSPASFAARGTDVRTFADPAAPTLVTIATVRPIGDTRDASAPRTASFLEHLAIVMLNRRLAAIAAGPDAPFRSAEFAIYDHFSTARLAEIELKAKDGAWRPALEAGAAALARALESGFTRAELYAALAPSRDTASAPAQRSNAALADAITDAVGRNIVFTAPAAPAASLAYFEGIELADVNAAFRAAWARPERLIFIADSKPIHGGDQAVASLFPGKGESTGAATSR